MPKHCCVEGCKASARNKMQSLHFHTVPSGERGKSWFKILDQRLKNKTAGLLFVCSSHFTKADYVSEKPNQLKKSAIPSRNLPLSVLSLYLKPAVVAPKVKVENKEKDNGFVSVSSQPYNATKPGKYEEPLINYICLLKTKEEDPLSMNIVDDKTEVDNSLIKNIESIK